MSKTTHNNTRAGHRRATPVQQRSEATVERILDAAMHVLQFDGIDGFNTNTVSAQANVNVGTVYHYFKDKNALITELFLRVESERVRFLATRLDSFVDTSDVTQWVEETLKTLLRLRLNTPGATVLRNAVRVIPSLHELSIDQDEQSASALAVALRARYPHVSRSRTEAIARIIIDAGVASLDRVGLGLGRPTAVINELTAMIVAYLNSLEQ